MIFFKIIDRLLTSVLDEIVDRRFVWIRMENKSFNSLQENWCPQESGGDLFPRRIYKTNPLGSSTVCNKSRTQRIEYFSLSVGLTSIGVVICVTLHIRGLWFESVNNSLDIGSLGCPLLTFTKDFFLFHTQYDKRSLLLLHKITIICSQPSEVCLPHLMYDISQPFDVLCVFIFLGTIDSRKKFLPFEPYRGKLLLCCYILCVLV